MTAVKISDPLLRRHKSVTMAGVVEDQLRKNSKL